MSGQDRTIVVGYDGSRCSSMALEWAVAEARRRDLALRLVYGLGWVAFVPPAPTGQLLAEAQLQASAEQVVEEGLQQVATLAPELEVTSQAYVALGATAALVEQSRTAELVVVGSRGRGGFAGLVLGSTSTAVAMHAHCPVVVVHEAGTAGAGASAGRVVVGVDGSERCLEAVEFAFAAASARGVGLTAVHGWTAPWTPASEGLPLSAAEWRGLHDREELLLAESVAGWATKYPDVEVTRLVVHGNPGKTLVEHSHGAELVVVGSRGRGGFVGLLLGSVSQAVVHHATCPVAVIHRRSREA